MIKETEKNRQVFVIMPSIDVDDIDLSLTEAVTENWDELSTFLSNNPVFFSKLEATNYNVYSLKTRHIIPFYVPESAVCSQDGCLLLDDKWLSLENFVQYLTPRMRKILVEVSRKGPVEACQDPAVAYSVA